MSPLVLNRYARHSFAGIQVNMLNLDPEKSNMYWTQCAMRIVSN